MAAMTSGENQQLGILRNGDGNANDDGSEKSYF